MSNGKLLKSEKIRIKNDKLRAKGKDPLKGWGKMINTGLGGFNPGINKFDHIGYINDMQKNIDKENEKIRFKD